MKLSKYQRVLITAALILVSIFIATFIHYRHGQNKSVVGQIVKTPVPGVTVSTSTPDETVPVKRAYAAAPTGSEPERIVIASIGVDGYVQRVSIDQNGAVAVPTNIHLAGWFTNSVTPGERGLSIIDGHVDGRVNDGVFKHLADVKKGDAIMVTSANGEVRNFVVMNIQSLPTAQAGNILFSQDPTVASQLNVITCGGSFNTTEKQYDQRVIVSAKLVQ